VLTANAPETKDNDFTWKDFQARNNNELLAVFGNFVNRTLVLTHKYFEGVIPAVGEMHPEDKAALEELAAIPEKITYSLDHFRFREALNEMMNMARLGNKYLTDQEPWKKWKTDPERVKTILNISLQICANLAVVAEPFLPFTAKKLAGFFNLSNLRWENAGKLLAVAGESINKPELLFEKIEDAQIDDQVNKLLKTKEENAAANVEVKPQLENITFDDFTKMDIRVGTILEAEKVAKTKKLLKLLVDTGVDKRTIVSGIAEHYAPEDIIGKQVTILINLAPRKIKGIESAGMILMAENHDGKLCFVSPIEEFSNGSGIS
jgi:methionyl-tRNA synthetase